MLYLLKEDHYLEGQYANKGDMVEWDGVPSLQMVPMDDEAVEAIKERFEESNPAHVNRILMEASKEPSARISKKHFERKTATAEPKAKVATVKAAKDTKSKIVTPEEGGDDEGKGDENKTEAPAAAPVSTAAAPLPAPVSTGVPAAPAQANPPAPAAPVAPANAAPTK